MAYPEPILPLEGEDAEEFEKKVKAFKVSNAQRARIKALRKKVRERASDK